MTNTRLILMVIGRPGVGKTTFGEYLARQHRFRFVEASSVLKLLALQVDRQGGAFGELMAAEAFIAKNGNEIVAKYVAAEIENAKSKAVITGFRLVEELKYTKKRFPKSLVVLVNSREELRFARFIERGRAPSIRTIDQFRLLEKRQMDLGLLGNARSWADVVIDNDGSMAEFTNSIDKLVTSLHRIRK